MPATARMLILCTALLLAVMCCGAGAQGLASAPLALVPAFEPASAPAPPPGLDCTNALLNLSACLTYVEVGSNQTVPDKGCCPGLKELVDSQPQCLCQLLASADIFGIKIDTTRALTLPTACRVQTPPVSFCAVLGIPVPRPMGPAPAPTSGRSGSTMASSPSTGLGSPTLSLPSSGSRITATDLVLFIGLVSSIAIF